MNVNWTWITARNDAGDSLLMNEIMVYSEVVEYTAIRPRDFSPQLRHLLSARDW